jgi:Domain of unknown function (DUF4055)
MAGQADADVSTPSLNYKDMAPHWELPHTLMGGTPAMRKKAQQYLPKEVKEQSKSYAARLQRSYLFPAYSKTVEALSGKPFSKQLVFKGPPELEGYTDDVDLTGRNLTTFANDLLRNGINDGIAYILVEHPAVDPQKVRTLDDYRKAGLRPYLVLLDASSVIEVISTRMADVDGEIKDFIQRVRIKEVTIEQDPKNEYNQIEVTRIRQLEPGVWKVFEKDQHGKWFMAKSGTTSIKVIPLVPFYTKRTDTFKAEPPLEDLAELNAAHWRSLSDQNNILHVARVPILFGAGFPDTTVIEVGANVMVTAKDPQAKLGYVEHTGQAIGSGEKDIENLEIRMAILGYEPLVAKATVTRTATEVVADKSDTISDLQRWCRGLERALEEAFNLMAQYMTLDLSSVALDINVDVDFDLLSRAATNIDVLLKARAARDLSRETFWLEMQRLGYLPESFDPAKEAAALDKEDAATMANWTANGGGPPNPEKGGQPKFMEQPKN